MNDSRRRPQSNFTLGSTSQTLKRSLELVGYEVGPARFPVTEVADGIDEKCIAMLDHYGIAHK